MTADIAPGQVRTYADHPLLDSTHWYGFVPREGDIVITSPLKSGTTWVQSIVANLIWQDGNFPAPIHLMSPWVDSKALPHTKILDRLEYQFHRRFLKSHLPADASPNFSEVIYLVLGRDPRDQFMSLWDQHSNYAPQAAASLSRYRSGTGAIFHAR